MLSYQRIELYFRRLSLNGYKALRVFLEECYSLSIDRCSIFEELIKTISNKKIMIYLKKITLLDFNILKFYKESTWVNWKDR